MNPLVFIRLECLKLAATDFLSDGDSPDPDIKCVTAAAKVYEKHVRRGIRIADLGSGCGCSGKSNTAEAKRKRQMLLHENAKALLDQGLVPMTLAQLVTDDELVLPQAAADRIDAKLKSYGLRRNVTGDDLAKWIETGLLPQ